MIVRTAQRDAVLSTMAAQVTRLPADRILRVGVDGVDGAGKTVFADELADALSAGGRKVIRAGVDGFHHPRCVRYRQGRDSPEGYYQDSYDYPLLRQVLLAPLGPSGDGRYRNAVFDYRTDRPVPVSWRRAEPGSILVFDGIFLHRPELREYWDYSVFLQVGFSVSIPRCAARGDGDPDPHAPSNRRYVDGQRLYLRRCRPDRLATVVLDNTDLGHPRVLSGPRFPS